MSVYIDKPRRYEGKRSEWSHMTADTRQELLHFAWVLGATNRPHSVRKGHPHIDVPSRLHLRALRLGAVHAPPSRIKQIAERSTGWRK